MKGYQLLVLACTCQFLHGRLGEARKAPLRRRGTPSRSAHRKTRSRVSHPLMLSRESRRPSAARWTTTALPGSRGSPSGQSMRRTWARGESHPARKVSEEVQGASVRGGVIAHVSGAACGVNRPAPRRPIVPAATSRTTKPAALHLLLDCPVSSACPCISVMLPSTVSLTALATEVST